MKNTKYSFYNNENNLNVKESFLKIANKISNDSFQSLADIGCASGAFPNYLKKKFPDKNIFGIEYSDVLIEKCNKDFPDVQFLKGNVLKKSSVNQQFDIVTMLGVLGIFDNYSKVLNNVLSWVKPRGKLYLHNMVSEFEIDVFIRYTKSNNHFNKDDLKSGTGWNIISEKSLKLVVEQNNAKILCIEPFNISMDLKKQKDVMRSWTEKNIHGQNDILNALHIRQPQKIITIEKF